ncbi:MAG: DNA-directed RNA polymerase subunit P [Candidatus Aenigmatarchaeota archaeon]
MRLRCSHCGHVWDTRKETPPVLCPYCKFSLYYHKPTVIRK